MAKIYGDEKTALDQFREMKNEPFKVKAQWFLQYYGLLSGIILGFLTLAIIVLVTIVNNSKPVIVSGLSYASDFEDETLENLKTYIVERTEKPKKNYRIDYSYVDGVFNPSGDINIEPYYISVQKTVAKIAAKDLDFFVGFDFMFTPYVTSDDNGNGACAFEDLRNIVPEDLYQKFEEEGRIQYLSGDFGDRPCMILLDGTELYDLLGLHAETQYIGFIVNAPHEESVQILINAIK